MPGLRVLSTLVWAAYYPTVPTKLLVLKLLDVDASLPAGAGPTLCYCCELSRKPPKLLFDPEETFYFASLAALYGYNLLTERCWTSPSAFLHVLALSCLLEVKEPLSFVGAFEDDPTAVLLVLRLLIDSC